MSYEEAANICKERASKISHECQQINKKYTDSDFDLGRGCGRVNEDYISRLFNSPDRASNRGILESRKGLVEGRGGWD